MYTGAVAPHNRSTKEDIVKRAVMMTMICIAAMQAGVTAEQAAAPRAKTAGVAAVNVQQLKEFSTGDVLKKTPLDTERLVYTNYFLKPRQVLRFQLHPASDELFYVVEGQGQFVVGPDMTMVESGSAVYGPAGVPHGLVNSGKTDLVLISVQSPRPVTDVIVQNSSVMCTVCKQEMIVPQGATDNLVIMCPRCKAPMKIFKTRNGSWMAKHA